MSSDFRAFVLRVEAQAKAAGIALSMSKLRDAIASAVVGRTYAAAMAAEAANKLPSWSLPPPHLEAAASRYGLDPKAFAAVFSPASPIAIAHAFLFGNATLADRWTEQYFWRLTEGLKEEADRQGLSLTLEAVKYTILNEAERVFRSKPATVTRQIVRTLAAQGWIDIGEYAHWIAEHGDGADGTEAMEDETLSRIPMWIYGSDASDEEIKRGVDAAEDVFDANRIMPARPFLAALLEACGSHCVQDDLDVWRAAEAAALKACFEGRSTWPERASLDYEGHEFLGAHRWIASAIPGLKPRWATR